MKYEVKDVYNDKNCYLIESSEYDTLIPRYPGVIEAWQLSSQLLPKDLITPSSYFPTFL